MLVVFLAIFVLGLAFATTLKKTYTAQSSLLVRLGQEYVYEPRRRRRRPRRGAGRATR